MVRCIGMRMGTGITMVITEDAWHVRARRIKKMSAQIKDLTARLNNLMRVFEAEMLEIKKRNAELEEINADQRERLALLRMRLEDSGIASS